jgi:hypothetical protein
MLIYSDSSVRFAARTFSFPGQLPKLLVRVARLGSDRRIDGELERYVVTHFRAPILTT